MMPSKFCMNCGAEIPIDSEFCSKCGKNINELRNTQEIHKKLSPKPKQTNKISPLIIIAVIAIIGIVGIYVAFQFIDLSDNSQNEITGTKPPKNTESDITNKNSNDNSQDTQIEQIFKIEIGPVHPNAQGNDIDNLNDEWVTLVCTSGKANLNGWKIKNAAGEIYKLPSITIKSGQTMKLYSGCGQNNPPNFYLCAEKQIWENNGDTIFLISPDGKIVNSWRIY